jgi:RNA polymerase-binding transcription factor DksA
MAKKVTKGKPVKKSAKPVKKAVAKKPAKKAPAKKAAKPVKKAAPKKVVKKAAAPKKAAKPVKKVVAKKPVKKAVVKKVVAKKVAPKKAAKPAPKPVAKKVVKKIEVKKAAKPAKKLVAPKKPVAPAKKEVAKKVVNEVVKEVKVAKPIPAPTKKPTAAAKKKQEEAMEAEEDNHTFGELPHTEYKTPAIRRPQGPTPKPFINTDKRTRYTDPELKEFKQLILKKLSEAQKDYELLKSTLSHRDDHGTDDTSPTFKLLEDGSDVLSKEETAHLAGRQEKFIQNLQNALIRIENKTYGICRQTGKLISKERLRSVPHATLAIEAKLDRK